MARLKFYNTETKQWEYADNLSTSYPIVSDVTQLYPEHYHVFGVVDSLSLNLVDPGDNKAHEYCFEFTPSAKFTTMSIIPVPKWVNEPQFPAGKTCQVSILRGIGVMICA